MQFTPLQPLQGQLQDGRSHLHATCLSLLGEARTLRLVDGQVEADLLGVRAVVVHESGSSGVRGVSGWVHVADAWQQWLQERDGLAAADHQGSSEAQQEPEADQGDLGHGSDSYDCGGAALFGGDVLAGLHAQHIPCNVRPQLFTTHRAACGPLDLGATFGRNAADTTRPLPDKLGLAADGQSDGGLAARGLIDVFGEVHKRHLKRCASFMQAPRFLPSLSASLETTGMKTAGQLRRENLERLVRETGTLEAVANKGETTSVYLSQIRNRAVDKSTGRPREMGPAMARRLEVAFGKAQGWMDVDHAAAPHPAVAPPPLPNQRFEDRHEVSESDFGLLQAVHMIMTDEEKASLRKRAEHALAVAMEQIGGLGGRK